MEPREQRGMELAATRTIRKKGASGLCRLNLAMGFIEFT